MFKHTMPAPPSAQNVGGGANSTTAADAVLEFCTAVNSSLSARTGAVQYSVSGIAGFGYTLGETPSVPLDDDTAAQATEDAEQYSAPGIIGRPLPPRNIDGNIQHMNVICAKMADGLVPIAYRDLRLQMGGDGPAEGVLAFVGYGGGFHSMTPVEDGDDPAGGGTVHVIYCPYNFDASGSAQNAHAIILDPTVDNESIIITHGNGLAITMSDSGDKALTLKNAAGDATLRLDDNGVTITAANIILSGGVIVGNPNTAVPLLAGAASPPSTVFYVSPSP